MSAPPADVRTALLLIVAKSAKLEPAAVRDDATFVGDLGLESVELVRLVCRIERAFDITLDVATLAPVRTVGELVSLVEGRVRNDGPRLPAASSS